ncbi:hypothetical protein L2E82_02609 [Cichorium intybus]|uniref:Uncharacterized protein n=1 Tax=Cichorium intybus TaxID=13427 RepID=A0ACB9H374_CICIN|nr:hypothetical protein L2E82_02609 [Cichorium intybus]
MSVFIGLSIRDVFSSKNSNTLSFSLHISIAIFIYTPFESLYPFLPSPITLFPLFSIPFSLPIFPPFSLSV